MSRIRLTYIYFIVVNLLLFHLLLDLPREVAYKFELYGHEWYGVGIFALAILVVLAHLVALGVSLIVYVPLKGLETFRHGRRVLQAVRPFELAVFLVFLYVNLIYFDIFFSQFQGWLLSAELSRFKLVFFILVFGVCLFLYFRFKGRIVTFMGAHLATFRRVALISLLVALALSTGRMAYMHSTNEEGSCSHTSDAILQAYVDVMKAEQLPNVIVLTPDGLSAEHMSTFGYFRKTTPFLDKLGETCTVFGNIWSTKPANTQTALTTFLLGKAPQTWMPRQHAGFVHEQDNAENLLRVLETLGYTIRVDIGGPLNERHKYCPDIYPGLRFKWRYGGRPYSRHFLRRLSFRAASMTYGLLDAKTRPWVNVWISHIKYLHDRLLGRVRRGAWKFAGHAVPLLKSSILRDRMNIDIGLAFLEQELRRAHEPVFLWIHMTDTPHAGYEAPEPYFGRFLKSEERYHQLVEKYDLLEKAHQRSPESRERLKQLIEKLTARYDEEILYMDAGIAEAFEILESSELQNPWILFITSDHGMRGIPDFTMEELHHIPLIICGSGLSTGQRVQVAGSPLDFAPTILELIGVAPPEWMEGKSLARFMKGSR